jgi:hypothetical protein
MKKLFIAFVESQNLESYLAVRAALVSSEHYDPYSNDINTVDELLAAGNIEAAQHCLSEAMPNLLLSPRSHLLASFIARESSNEPASEMEGFLAAICCRGILMTGDGTRSNPYIVLRSSDEYDVAQYLEKEPRMQSLVHDGNRHLDRIECSDGSELWFDVTDAYNRLQDALGGN